MRVVVTGSVGRVGRAIVRRLATAHDVVGVDRLPGSTAVQHVGDVTDPDVLARACRGADAVIHAAALHSPHVGIVPESEFERVNVEGTAAIVAAARRAGIRRVVFTSTTAVYGRASQANDGAAWIDEDVEPAPVTIYHRTKLAAEALLREAAGSGLEVRVLRMSRCFPEPADVMAVYRLHRGVDARDVASAHEAALTHRGGPYAMWLVSGATPFHRADRTLLGCDATAVVRTRVPELALAYERRGWSLPQTIDRVYDARRAMRDLGWTPRFGPAAVMSMWEQEHAEILPPHIAARS